MSESTHSDPAIVGDWYNAGAERNCIQFARTDKTGNEGTLFAVRDTIDPLHVMYAPESHIRTLVGQDANTLMTQLKASSGGGKLH